MEDVTPEDEKEIAEGMKAIGDAFASIADSATKALEAIQKFKEHIGDEDVEVFLRRLHDELYGPDSDDNPQ